ncbi:two-component sensor histidine kinase [Sphaerisporangium rufum]|uniref:Two-component sensor histidine kinase n=1 Tax=Sphaerisporangium rufum TaxID=1381558 RepID=A0A919R8K1_9ACTN|nr:sensor histidine kinase [Sphaerisporangium rufum]GII79237.1 two-component sensor histidine kinase [Sphaerisporangium rufum]
MSRLAEILNFTGSDPRRTRWRRLLGLSVGLVYLVYPAGDLVSGAISGVKACWAAVALVAFVAAYVGTALSPRDFGEPGRWTHPLLGLLVLMALVFPLIFGGGWLALPIYATVVIGMALPTRAALPGVAGMAGVVLADGLSDGADSDTLLILVLQVVTVGVLFMSVRNTRVLVHRLQQAQGEVARLAAGEERLRISRDLHDLLGHSLSLIVLKSELAGRLAEQDPPRAVREIRDVEAVARQALGEVREAVTGYRQRGLAEELDGARTALCAAGVTAAVRTTGTPLPAELDGLFAWAVREGVTNVVRHAGAGRCDITITCTEEAATLDIEDDGHAAGPVEPGSGLCGLAERVDDAGGSMEARPGPSGGFRLRLRVPIPVPVPVVVPAETTRRST